MAESMLHQLVWVLSLQLRCAPAPFPWVKKCLLCHIWRLSKEAKHQSVAPIINHPITSSLVSLCVRIFQTLIEIYFYAEWIFDSVKHKNIETAVVFLKGSKQNWTLHLINHTGIDYIAFLMESRTNVFVMFQPLKIAAKATSKYSIARSECIPNEISQSRRSRTHI